MDKPLVSVIIPIYNTQDYIVECLESVRKQTYPCYEVIMVNDGSTDNSEAVILDYIKNSELKNYYLINKENGGVSSARNAGLARAKGEWITFVDSDDWLEPNFLSNMIEADDKYNADFYLSGLRAYEMQQQRFDVWTNFTVEHGKMPKGLKYITFFDSACGRLYKKSILDEYSICFDERVKYCEDNAFNFDYAGVIKDFVCINQIGYNYRRGRSDSMSKWAINPHMRRYFAEHRDRFCQKIPYSDIIDALKENVSFTRIMWNVQLTDVVVDILEKNTSNAKEKMKLPLAKAVVDYYHPCGKKDKVQKHLWNKPFFVFKLFVNVFYKNVDKIKKVKWLAHFLTH